MLPCDVSICFWFIHSWWFMSHMLWWIVYVSVSYYLEGCTKRERQGTPFFVIEMFMRRLLLSGFSGSPTLERVIDSSDAQRYVKILIRWLGSSENCSQSWRLKQLLWYVVIGTSLIRKIFPGTHIPVDLAVEVFFMWQLQPFNAWFDTKRLHSHRNIPLNPSFPPVPRLFLALCRCAFLTVFANTRWDRRACTSEVHRHLLRGLHWRIPEHCFDSRGPTCSCMREWIGNSESLGAFILRTKSSRA